MINEGSRVRVKIQDPKTYAIGCAQALDGRAGYVVQFSPKSGRDEQGFPAPAWLVKFDEPATPWWSHGSPVYQFWFAPSELELI
jgi:hypothetical protein